MVFFQKSTFQTWICAYVLETIKGHKPLQEYMFYMSKDIHAYAQPNALCHNI